MSQVGSESPQILFDCASGLTPCRASRKYDGNSTEGRDLCDIRYSQRFLASLEMTALQRYFGIVALGREPLLLNAIMVREGAIRGFVQ